MLQHWMTHVYALTFTAFTLRVYIGISHVASMPFCVAYAMIFWPGWTPNLLIAEWFIRSGASS